MRFTVIIAAIILAAGWNTPVCAEVTTSTKIIHVALDKATTLTVAVVIPDFQELIEQTISDVPSANADIVKALLEYPTDGTHTYFWPRKGESSYDGVTTDIVVNGVAVLRGEEKARAFCCGLTLQVAYDVMKQDNYADILTSASVDHQRFRKLWYCEELFSPGPTDALVWAKLGEKIDANDAVLGDFLQIWRHNKSGHSVIFLDWALDTEGKLVGIHYWSTQTSTDGIGFNTELLGESGKAVDLSRSGFSRLTPPASP